ncbi:MAG: hypothetical protein LAT55_04975 [Opitutales bacterium]|nr:hypothetical protein [Opitutales bacterium]
MPDPAPPSAPPLPQRFLLWEKALESLPSEWNKKGYWQNRLKTFAREWENLSGSVTANSIEIAIVGPKNGGKTLLTQTLAGLSGESPHPPSGLASAAGTDRLTWYAHTPPSSFDPKTESFVETAPLTNIIPDKEIRLADVPGSNELQAARALSARRILQRAAVKVLVVPANQVEDRDWSEYLQDARGGWVLPVLNLLRTEEQQELVTHLLESLHETHDPAQVLPPVLAADWALSKAERPKEKVLAETTQAIQKTLAAHLANLSEEAILAPERTGRWENFQKAWVRDWGTQFPHALPLIEKLTSREAELPQNLSRLLFTQDAAFRYHYQMQVLSRFWAHSPGFLFPWKGLLGVATILRGALAKIPFLFMGSLPSAAASAYQAIRNTASLKAWKGLVSRDPSDSLHQEVSEELAPALNQLDRALALDLGQPLRTLTDGKPEKPSVSIVGLKPFLRQNEQVMEKNLARHQPGRILAGMSGLLGFFIFWGIFVWPLVGLYADHFHAVSNLLQGNEQGSWATFPSGAGSTFLTTFFLALLPMLLYITLLHSLLLAPRRIQKSLQELKSEQEELLLQYNSDHRLRIDLDHPLASAIKTLGSDD